MRMIEAFQNAVFRNYANFSGRTRRAEYWWYQLCCFCIALPVSFVGGFFLAAFNAHKNNTDAIIGMVSFGLLALIAIALIIPNLAIQVRRLHDIGISGWWILLAFIPYAGPVVMLILMLLPSKASGERYGAFRDSLDQA